MDTYEFKIKSGLPWELTPVLTAFPTTPQDAKTFASGLSQLHKTEIRYNRLGSLQGHYSPVAWRIVSEGGAAID